MPVKITLGKETLAEGAVLTSSPWRMGWGLMFHPRPKPIIFDLGKEKKASLHMLFVFFSIDVLFLDENKKVVDKKESFKPFSFYFAREKCRYVVELPEGKARGAEVGDFVSLKKDI